MQLVTPFALERRAKWKIDENILSPHTCDHVIAIFSGGNDTLASTLQSAAVFQFFQQNKVAPTGETYATPDRAGHASGCE